MLISFEVLYCAVELIEYRLQSGLFADEVLVLREGFQGDVVCKDGELASCNHGSEVLQCIHNSQSSFPKVE